MLVKEMKVKVNRMIKNKHEPNVPPETEETKAEKKRLEQKNTELNRALISGEGEQDNQNLEKIGKNIIFSGKVVNDIPSKDLRTFVDNIKKQNKNV